VTRSVSLAEEIAEPRIGAHFERKALLTREPLMNLLIHREPLAGGFPLLFPNKLRAAQGKIKIAAEPAPL
jgi:hypothetical protein